jgi:hypothetical protein
VTCSERALTSTWVVDDVRGAVEHGYLVLKINEFYEYEITQYDPKTEEGGHFVQYIETFLKLKAEANRYTGWVQGPKDEEKYVQCFQERTKMKIANWRDCIKNRPKWKKIPWEGQNFSEVVAPKKKKFSGK